MSSRTRRTAPTAFAIDVDGDGDVDALSASANDDTVAWYENDVRRLPAAVTADIQGAARGPCLWAAIDSFAAATVDYGGALFDYGNTATLGDFTLRVFGTDGSLRVDFWGSWVDVALAGSDDGDWHHYCLTYDGPTADPTATPNPTTTAEPDAVFEVEVALAAADDADVTGDRVAAVSCSTASEDAATTASRAPRCRSRSTTTTLPSSPPRPPSPSARTRAALFADAYGLALSSRPAAPVVVFLEPSAGVAANVDNDLPPGRVDAEVTIEVAAALLDDDDGGRSGLWPTSPPATTRPTAA
ncbi:hypothetical protein JL720_11185 [Aureococcus anophagefferens]|nr:hypothetical protein JL720_11185 [Aureococcus anophagefferens]